MFSIGEAKKEALSKLRGRWKTPVLLTLVIGAINLALSLPSYLMDWRELMNIADNLYLDWTAALSVWRLQTIGGIFSLAVFVIDAAIAIALARFYLTLAGSPEKAAFNTFFEGLTHWGKGILATLWMSLWMWLWSLLFFGILIVLMIVGAVIGAANGGFDFENIFWSDNPVLIVIFCVILFVWFAAFIIVAMNRAYAYSQMFFIQAEYPTVSVTKTLKASIVMTKGCRGKLLLLDLSFIGWGFLAALTLGIGYLWLAPYWSTARAAAYRRLKAKAFENGLFVTGGQSAVVLPQHNAPPQEEQT